MPIIDSKPIKLIFSSLFAAILFSCNGKYDLKLLVAEKDKVLMENITREINIHSEFDITVHVMDSLTEIKAIESVLDHKYDITPVDNTLDYRKSKKNIRTILPLFHEFMVVLSRHQLSRREIDSLLKKGDYLILTKEVEELDIYQRMMPKYSGDSTLNYRIEDHFNLEEDLKIHELLLFFTGRENFELGQMLFEDKAFIYSLDDRELKGNGSFIEGFCRDYKKTTPYVLSRDAFGIVLDEPIFTISVHELLVTTSDTPNQIVYDLIEAIHGHHIIKIFDSSNNYSFEVNHEDINLSFPFHSGTINYMNREKPKFVERYATTMSFMLSFIVLLGGFIATLRAAFKRRKKDRMDEYYKELLHIKENNGTIDTEDKRARLNALQKKVFELLIKEKLSANNEFLIFMRLWSELYGIDDTNDL